MKKIFLCCFINACYLSSVLSQIDTDFWFVAPEVSKSNENFDRPIVFRITAFNTASNVTISQPDNPTFPVQNFTVPANSTYSADLTTWIASIENTPPNQVLNRGFHIEASDSITIYYEIVSSQCECNPEIFVLKGRNALGFDFVIPSQNSLDNSSYGGYSPTPYAAFDIVATEDNTIVSIIPASNIVGHSAGNEFTITLDQGQTYSARASSQFANAHLGGSTVSSNKPIAITIKDDLLEIYAPVLFANLAGDQTVPVNITGTRYIVVKGGLYDDYERAYVIAIDDNTDISISGTFVATIDAGETYEIILYDDALYLETSSHAYVYHTSGLGYETGGEVLPHIDCTGSTEVSFVRSEAQELLINLVVPTGSEDDFQFNGNSGIIVASDFSTVPGTAGNWKFARKNISTLQLPEGGVGKVSNSSSKFHLGYMNGLPLKGARYGYFSNYGSEATSFIDTSLCGNTYTLPDGMTVNESGIYFTSIDNPGGCDSTVVTDLTFQSFSESFLSADICEGGEFTIGGQTFSLPGNYDITLTTNTGCDSIIHLDLSLTPAIVTFLNETICNGESIIVGGQSYSTSGIYTSTLIADSGCDSIVVLTLTVLPYFVTDVFHTICQGGSITIGTQTFSNPGNYQITLLSQQGCDSIINLTLSTSLLLETYLPVNLCVGDSVIVGNQIFDEPGIFEILLESLQGCDSLIHLELSIYDFFEISLSDTICEGESITIGNQVFNQSGFYSVPLLSLFGCDSLVQLELTVNPSYFTNLEETICQGETISIGNQTFSDPGTYTVYLQSSNGCDSTITLDLTLNTPYFINLADTICAGDSLLFGGTFLLESGIYSQYLQSVNGCDSTVSLSLFVIQAFSVDLGMDTTIYSGETIVLTGELIPPLPIEEVIWTPPGIIPCDTCLTIVASPAFTTVYNIVVNNIFGCSATDELTVGVNPIRQIYLPNTFSPNFDGINDKFYPICGSGVERILLFSVYDRWGNHLYEGENFEPNDPLYGWDGTYRGKEMQSGVYVYFCYARFQNGEEALFKGDINVIR
jgi:gliding motility-associated-like protein